MQPLQSLIFCTGKNLFPAKSNLLVMTLYYQTPMSRTWACIYTLKNIKFNKLYHMLTYIHRHSSHRVLYKAKVYTKYFQCSLWFKKKFYVFSIFSIQWQYNLNTQYNLNNTLLHTRPENLLLLHYWAYDMFVLFLCLAPKAKMKVETPQHLIC